MSEFLAEARVLITPDTTRFRADLERALTAASKQVTPIRVPVTAAVVGSDLTASVAAAAGSTAGLVAAQEAASKSTLGLATDEAALARAYGVTTGQVEILSAATLEAAGSQTTLDAANKKGIGSLLGAGTSAGKLDAALLGLRTAAGSAAVIGLGAVSLAAIAAGKAIRGSIQSAAELEQQLNTFEVTANATATEMEAVAQAAQDLGRDASLPATTAGDAAEAMTELAKAGLDVTDSIDGARGVLQLAAAAQIDVADATELSANALNTFALQGNQATHVADLLTGASQAAQGDIQTMGIALGQAGAAAKLAGVSLEDTIALVALLAKNGLAGSDAGTSLRTAFLALASPTDKARKIIEGLNLQLTDLNGNLRPEIFAEFFQATSGVSRLEQLNLAVQVFGRDAVRALGLIGSEGVGALEEMRSRTDEAGLAAKVAGARMRGLSGDVEALSSNVSTLGTTLGTLATPVLSSVVSGLNDAVKGIDFLIEGLGKLPLTPVVEETGNAMEQLDRQIAETQKQIDSFGEGNVPPALIERLAELNQKWAEMSGATHDANLGLAEFIDKANQAAAAAEKLANPVANAAQVLGRDLAVAAAQGNTSQELNLLRQREANQQAFLDRILKRPQSSKNVELAEQAARNLEQTRQQIQSILDGQEADTKAAASKAAQTRADTDQALLEMLGAGRQAAQNQIIKAQGTATLKDDISSQEALLTILTKQLDRIRKTVKDAKTRASAIAAVVAEMVQVGQEIKRLRKAQSDAILAAAEERQQRIEQSAQLDIDFAQITGNREAEIKARQRLIALLKKELREVKKGTNAWKELRNAIAEQQQAIKEAQNQKKEADNSASSAGFEFLQKQQGFAANLLGNLIPGFATAGLVGGSSSAQGPTDIGANVQTSAQVEQSRSLGVRPVQVDTTNALLRQILAAVSGRGRPAPETVHNRRVGSAMMDTLGGIHGA